MDRRSLLASSLATAFALAFAPVLAAQSGGLCNNAIEYGMNPSFQTWSSRAIVFADAFQRVRSFSYWQNGPLSPAVLIPTGSGRTGAGWPDPAALGAGKRYGAMLFGSMESTIPDGRASPYVVTWKGAGHVRLEGVFVKAEAHRGDQRVEVFVDPFAGSGDALLSISWTTTDPADPVRDVHVWLPGMEGSGRIFWPPFMTKVGGIGVGSGPHTWRTLDWTRVNEYGRSLAHGGFVFDLAGVVRPSSPSQGTLRGVATEYQVAFCNESGANLHLQLPHRTSAMSEGDYVTFLTQELRIVRDGAAAVPGINGGQPFRGLDPRLTVTVELSNEIWNSIFGVNAWMNAEAVRKGISFSEQVAGEIQLLFDVADAVFSGSDAPRLRKYVAGFSGDPGYLRRILQFLRAGTRIDALGPAAYIGPRRPDLDAWLAGSSAGSCPNCPDAAGLLAAARASIDSQRPLLAQHRGIAASWTNPDGSHPALELYEGGVNLKAAGQPWITAAHEVQRSRELFDLLHETYVPMLVAEGVELINWYSFMTDQNSLLVDGYGMWNDMRQNLTLPVVLPYQDQGAPKAALINLGPPLADTCPRAGSRRIDAPANFPVYTCDPPVLGSLVRVRVDLGPSGDTQAWVVASPTPTSVLTPSGQTVFTTLGGAQFLPPRVGPVATWELRIPHAPILAGQRLYTQAVLSGSSSTVNLTNGLELTFGL